MQFGITHPSSITDKVFQGLIKLIWEMMLYVFNGIMVMLSWAFSLDLTKERMPQLTTALQTLHKHIDSIAGLAAVAFLALGVLWNGLVRRKTIDSIRGLFFSLFLMVGFLVIISNPPATLGKVTELADGASTEMLNSITSGNVKEPEHAVGSVEKTLFQSVILGPWCVLQFGDVKYCEGQPKGLNQSVAETWLQAPPESSWRTSLWRITNTKSVKEARIQNNGEAPPGENRDLGDMYALGGHPERVALIGGGFVMPRLGLLLLMVIGIVGAMALFGYLAGKLLMAALMFLVLVMFLPGMIIIAALGEPGRASAGAVAKRAFGAAVAKVIYAFLLADVVAGSNLIATLKFGFFPTWLIFGAFWWAIFLKRKDLLALLTLDQKAASAAGLDFEGSASGNALSQLYFAKHLAGDARRGAQRLARGATAAPRFAIRHGSDAVKRRAEASRVGKSDAGRQLAREELQREGREVLEQRNAAEHATERGKSQKILGKEKDLKQKLAEKDNEIQRKRSERSTVATRASLGTLGDERLALSKSLIKLQSSPGYRQARSSARSKPREVSDRDVNAWVEGRRAELAERTDSKKNLEAAGIDPKAHKKGSPAEQGVNREMARQKMQRHEMLIDRAGVGHRDDEGQVMSKRERILVRKEAREGGRKDHFKSVSRGRAKRHRQGLKNEQRDVRRRRRYVR